MDLVINPMILKHKSEFISKLKKWGFNVNSHNLLVNGIEEIEKHHKYIETLRSSLDYDIDGIVYKVNDLNLQKDLEIPQIHPDGQPLINFHLKKQFLRLKIYYSSGKNRCYHTSS